MSAEPVQETSPTEGRSPQMAARDVYPQQIPDDQARQEEERCSQEEALEALWDELQAMNRLQHEAEQTEQEKHQRQHQLRDAPIHKVTNSDTSEGYQPDSCEGRRDGHKQPAREWTHQVKEAVAEPPLLSSRSGHHPEQKLKQSIPDVPSRDDQQICRPGCTLHERTQEGQAIRSKEAPPPTKSIFSIFATSFNSSFKSRANVGSSWKDNAQEELSAHSASMMNQLCDILTQLSVISPSIVNERSKIIAGVILNYGVPWLEFLLMLPCSTHPVLAYVIAGTHIAMDMSGLYQCMNVIRYDEDLNFYTGTLVLQHFVRYYSLVFMAEHLGPACAISLVQFIPELTNVMQRICWFWRCTGTKEEPLAQISFQRYCRPDVAYIQGPFPNNSNNNGQSAILHSFDVNSESWSHAVAWDMLLETVQHASCYVVLFSGDSWLSRTMALAFAYFVGSKYCPRPRTADDARSVHDLIVRAYNEILDSGTVGCPSMGECLDHQPIVSHYLRVIAIKMVENVEGRPIDDGGFHSLGAPAISLFFFLVFLFPVATILTLGWHWFGPTVTITFS